MKAGGKWPQRVIRRAMYAIPFCMLFNALSVLIMLAYGNGILDAWIVSESLQRLNSAILISFIFIMYNFLSFFYQLCLLAVRSLGRCFRAAFIIGCFFVVIRVIAILIYGYLFAAPPGVVNGYGKFFMRILSMSAQTECLMNILDEMIILMLLLGFEELLPEKEKNIRGIIRALRWVFVLLIAYAGLALFSVMPFMNNAGWLKQITGPYMDQYILFYILPDFVSFTVLLAAVIRFHKIETFMNASAQETDSAGFKPV